MKTDAQLNPPWERQFYGKSKFTMTELKRQLSPLKRELAKAAHNRLVQKAREFVKK